MIDNLVVAFWNAAYASSGFSSYLVGCMDLVQYTRHPKTGHMMRSAPLMRNVYYDPLALIDDLLRPPIVANGPAASHVTVSWGAVEQIERVTVAAIAEPPALYLADPTPDVVAVWSDVLRRMAGESVPVVIMTGNELDIADEDEFSGWRDEHRAWLERARNFSVLRANGFGTVPRTQVAKGLNDKTWCPRAQLATDIGHPDSVDLEDVREGLGLAPHEMDATVDELWAAGLVFEVVAGLQHQLTVLAELVQQASYAPKARILVNKLPLVIRDSDGDVIGHSAANQFRSGPGAKWKYHVPAGDWEDHLRNTARAAGTLPPLEEAP